MSLFDIKALAELGIPRYYKPGERIFAFGDLPTSVFILVSGSIHFKVTRSDGSVITFETISEGLFGEVAVLLNVPRTASAFAEGQVEVKEIGLKEFQLLLDSNSRFRGGLLTQMADRLRRSGDQIQRTISRPPSFEEIEPNAFQKLVDKAAEGLGSVKFLFSITLVSGGWVLINTYLGTASLDQGFIYLALFLSLLSIAITCIVLNSQNRNTKLLERRNQIEFHANLLAQQQTEALHDRFSDLLKSLNK